MNRVCEKHGTPQYVPDGQNCPYCEGVQARGAQEASAERDDAELIDKVYADLMDDLMGEPPKPLPTDSELLQSASRPFLIDKPYGESPGAKALRDAAVLAEYERFAKVRALLSTPEDKETFAPWPKWPFKYMGMVVTSCPHVPKDTMLMGRWRCLDCAGEGHGFLALPNR